MRMRAGTTQKVAFEDAFSPKTWREHMESHYRPTTHEQVLQGVQTDLRVPQEPYARRRLDSLL
jgi:hypothetical protein